MVLNHQGEPFLPTADLTIHDDGRATARAFGMNRTFQDGEKARLWVEENVRGEVGANCDGLAVVVFDGADS